LAVGWTVISSVSLFHQNDDSKTIRNRHDNVYGPVLVAVNCHCESSPGSFGQSSMSARYLPIFRPDQLNQLEP